MRLLPRPSHRIHPCKFVTSAAPACAFPPSASAATILASAPICETSRKVIHKAIDLGITLFDTADIYAGMGGSGDRAGHRARRPPQGHRAGDEIFAKP